MTLPTPFYDQDGITIYCGDNRQIIPLLGTFDLLLTDPPYGIGQDNRRKILSRNKAALPKDYGDTDWDCETAADWLMTLCREKCDLQIIFGGNYYSLPPCVGPLIWDKENSGDFADGEMAWNNLGSAMRIKRHLWNGMIRKDQEERFHPTQKPLDVMSWCLSHAPEGVSSS